MDLHRNIFAATPFLLILAVGCAHSQKKVAPETAAPPVLSSAPATSQTVSSPKRMPLPYTFYRRGVKIRANSVEFSKDKLLVSASIEETRGQEGFIRPSTLIEARMAVSKDILPYAGSMQDGKLVSEPGITLSANQKILIDLVFQLAGGSAGAATPVELHFSTGKWWSSEP